MKYGILIVLLLSCVVSSGLSFWVGFKADDSLLLIIGGLLVFASILIALEIKKVKKDPF
ncbi:MULTISPECIES: hypothetical protein [Acinetobacter]|uniref:hypothetical protein n=1 Tax=Acinetobacter TaxID=469 RepID=UPI0003A26753|nr:MULTISPECIES: hypothetical protein [Acinetobacter]MBA0156362.1 hypothetical protein [Acinetobacter indicus]MDM1275548.1 hypothetical protein [Acinetobacter indicus]